MSAAASRFVKVSAAGVLLPADAVDWVAVYDSAQQLTFTRNCLPGGARTWSKAKAAATKLKLCGWNDWRLGELQEWQRAFDYTRTDFALDPAFFTLDGDEYWVWTGTNYARASGFAWYVGLHDGYSYWCFQGGQCHARAVRAGQLSWPLEVQGAT